MTRDPVTLRSIPDIPDCPHCKTPMRLIRASPSEVPKIRMETLVFVCGDCDATIMRTVPLDRHPADE